MLKHENTSMSPARHPVRALCLAPTRELADQVANNVKAYAKHTLLRVACVFGGIDMKPQTAELKAGVEVLIATPGRLLDHIEAKNCVLNQLEYVVLDEADRMLDIGFLPDLQRILSYLPKQRQTLLFSATFSPEIRRLSQSYLQDPVLVEVARPNATATNVEQRFYSVSDDDKRRAVQQIMKSRSLTQALVFVNSKLGAARLARSFERDGFKTTALHGDKSQDERLKALAAFKRGEVDLLVATDVAARGLDIVDLPGVFNFDVPFNAEDYVHRIGRTGPSGSFRPRGDAGRARRHAACLRYRETDQEEDRARAARVRRRAAAPPAPFVGRGARCRTCLGTAAARRASRAHRPVLRPALRAECHRDAGMGGQGRNAGRAACDLAEHQTAQKSGCVARRQQDAGLTAARPNLTAQAAQTPPVRCGGIGSVSDLPLGDAWQCGSSRRRASTRS